MDIDKFNVRVGAVAFSALMLVTSCSAAAGPSTTASAPPASTVTPSASPSADCARSANAYGELRVCPAEGSIGTRLAIEGRNCLAVPGASSVYLVFGSDTGQATGTEGAVDIGTVPVDTSGGFHVDFAVPERLHPIQQSGGGATRPGRYFIYTKPAECSVPFVVH